MKQLFYKEHLIENESVRIAENLEKFLLGIGLEQNDIDHAKNTILVSPHPDDYYITSSGCTTKITVIPVSKIIGTNRSTSGNSIYENIRCIPDTGLDYSKFQRYFNEFSNYNSLKELQSSFCTEIEPIRADYYPDTDEYFICGNGNHRTLTAMLIGAPYIKAKVCVRECNYYIKKRYDIEQSFKKKYHISKMQGYLLPGPCKIIIHFQNPPVIIHGFEINGAKSQIDNINLLSEQIDKDLKEYKFLNKIKNPIIRNLLMKIADINNPRMHQYFVDDLLTTSDPEIKLYKFNS